MRRHARAALIAAAWTTAAVPFAAAAPVVGEGVDLTGATSLAEGPATGRGLVIAVLDLGFGRRIAERQREGELPPTSRLETRSFDDERGLAGANAFGNRTAHGEEVAQVVYDFAPGARYLFANYHTPAEFVSAARWLADRRPDIVVHSNNFLLGPFDGTGPAAREVDRVAAGGALWFNSAGNYGRQQWRGGWRDDRGDGALDPTDAWRFERRRGQTISFALSWPGVDGAEATDLDLSIERETTSGWSVVRESRARQVDDEPSSESLSGIVAPADGEYRIRVRWRSGPPPEEITLLSRELELGELGPGLGGSVPTPADADGAIAVGAVDWRTDALKAYSSRGPSPDGRLKPDLVAPTGTSLRSGEAVRKVGGTSIAAPNAAGAAAVLWWALRRAGLDPSADEIRAELVGRARDLGAPGPDPRFGHGLVRLDDDPPEVRILAPAGPVSGRVRVIAHLADASPLRSSVLAIDGRRVSSHAADAPVAVRWLDTRQLADGPHVLDVSALDAARNRGAARRALLVDNTPPTLALRRVRLGRPTPAGRRVEVLAVAADSRAGEVRVDVTATGSGAARGVVRRRSGPGGATVAVPLGVLPPGRYRIDVVAIDRAGNATARVRTATVRVPASGPPGQATGP